MVKLTDLMSHRVVHPQELEVWYAIPAIRREIAKEMKRRGLGQKQIAGILGVTEAAVSQYFSRKRAHEIKFGAVLKKEIMRSVDKILNNPDLIVQEVQRILDLPEIRLQLCEIHGQCKGACTECRICAWSR